MMKAELTSNGEFGVYLPDGTLFYCTVNSGSRRDAELVVASINDDWKPTPSLSRPEKRGGTDKTD